MFALFTLELKKRYPGVPAIILEAIGLVLSLGLYYFIARSFMQNWRDYFIFLAVGEASLYGPVICFHGIPDTLKQMTANQTLEILLTVKRPLVLVLIEFALSAMAREWIRAVFVISAAAVLTNTPLSVHALSWLVAQVFAIPAFLGLGLLSAILWLRFRRGDGVLSLLNSAAIFVSGAYFPAASVPAPLLAVLKYISPYNLVISAVREPSTETMIILLIGGVMIFLIALGLFQSVDRWMRRTGNLPV